MTMRQPEDRTRHELPTQGPPEVPPGAPEVDLRILQANERTLLAWVRTGLALMAFGFVVARISPWLSDANVQRNDWSSAWTGAAFLVLGATCNVAAAVRYARIRSALLEGRSVVPGGAAVLSLALGLALLGGLLAVHALLH
jgi:putative membrane protein